MNIDFTKMHGAGNDFMVVEWPNGVPLPDAELIRRWADRRLGIGFDQLLLLLPPTAADVDRDYRIFNADGGEVEQCGNGARCLARHVGTAANKDAVRLSSPAGVVSARLLGHGEVTIELGVPRFEPSTSLVNGIPQADRYRLTVGGREVEFGAVSVGNPHAVIAVDSVDEAPVGILGPAFQHELAFPEGVNVGFMEVVSQRRVRLRVFERGVGETPACGTGAAAAVVVGRSWGLLAARVGVELPGGTLGVKWQGDGAPVWLSGMTTVVFEGHISI
jgi:diaminopimelate epimerase